MSSPLSEAPSALRRIRKRMSAIGVANYPDFIECRSAPAWLVRQRAVGRHYLAAIRTRISRVFERRPSESVQRDDLRRP